MHFMIMTWIKMCVVCIYCSIITLPIRDLYWVLDWFRSSLLDTTMGLVFNNFLDKSLDKVVVLYLFSVQL